MSLTRLHISNVRNLPHLELSLSPQLNAIHGRNGSGKTSILESIHILSTGRSFLNEAIRSVIRHGQDGLIVFGEVICGGSNVTIGIERQAGTSRIRINGRTPDSVAELLEIMPVQYLGPDSQKLLEMGPKERRKLLDWGVFHVEHGFYPQWRRFYRALKQRNAVLKSRESVAGLKAWNQELVGAAQYLHRYRRSYMESLLPFFSEYLVQLSGPSEQALTADYYPGWNEDHAYGEILERSLERDLRLGFTQYGPHRADLVIKANGYPASEALSRGQLKLIVIALRLAQVSLMQKTSGRRCVFLMDDLPSELDQINRTKVLTILLESGAQIFVTSTDADALMLEKIGISHDKKVFHVEHGSVTEVV